MKGGKLIMKINFRLPVDIKEKMKINIEQIEEQIDKLPKIWFLRSRKKEEQFINKISSNINKLNELRQKYPCGECTALYNSIFNKIDNLKLKNPPQRLEEIDKSKSMFNVIKDKVIKAEKLCDTLSSDIDNRAYLKEHREISLKDLNKVSEQCTNDLEQIEEISKDYDDKIHILNERVNGDSDIARRIIENIKKFNLEKESACKAVKNIKSSIKQAKSNIFKTDRIYSMSNTLRKTVTALRKNCESGKAYSTELISSSNGVLTMAENTKQEIESDISFLDDVVGGQQISYSKFDSLRDNSSKHVEYLKNAQENNLNELMGTNINKIDKA